MSLDLGPLLDDFDYKSGEVVARKIVGLDGREKIQMRTELGLIQMEADGSPDGVRPHGCESLLHYHRERVESREWTDPKDASLALTTEDCRALRDEATTYYLRYVCCLRLRDFARAVRDTGRNLEAMDFCSRHAAPEDAEYLERYRPYVLMMHARARAGQFLEMGELSNAADTIAQAVLTVKRLLEAAQDEPSPPSDIEDATDLAGYADLDLVDLGLAPQVRLRLQLQEAVEREDYKLAAQIRDSIRALDEGSGPDA
jgi:hypothetical protein